MNKHYVTTLFITGFFLSVFFIPLPSFASGKRTLTGVDFLASVSSVFSSVLDNISDIFVPLFYREATPLVVIYKKNNPTTPLVVSTPKGISAPSLGQAATQTIVQRITTPGITEEDLTLALQNLKEQLQHESNSYAAQAAGYAVDSLGRNQVVNGNMATGGDGTFTGTIDATDLSSSHGLVLHSYAPADTNDLLYNTNDSLYWRGNLVAGAAVGTWTTSGGNVYRESGNVGIGTNLPTHQFEVVGTANVQGNTYLNSNVFIDGNTYANKTFFGSPSTDTGSVLQVFGNADVNSDFHVLGNVGIGTTTPSAKLAVEGSLYIGNNSVPTLFVNPTTNNVAIGGISNNGIAARDQTSSLSVVGTTRFIRQAGSQGAQNGITFTDQSNNQEGAIGTDGTLTNDFQFLSTNSMRFYTGSDLVSSNERVRFDSNGNVGIGTTNPQYKLDVNGTLRSSNIYTNLTAGDWSQYVGYGAGNQTNTGTNNNLFGGFAGNLLTTGSQNNFFGYGAGLNTTTGSYNTFNGQFSGYSNTTGSNNSFFGTQTGQLSTTGSENSFFGARAGLSNTTGTGNIALGIDAGRANSTGNYNLSIGYGAGFNGTTANLTNATAIGYNAQVTQSNSLILGGTGSDAVNVGIGTTDPGAKLEIYGGNSSDQLRIGNGAPGQYKIGRNAGTGVLDFSATQANASGYVFSNSSTELFRITDSGNVGIGTSNPGAKLDVYGNIQISSANYGNGSLVFSDGLGTRGIIKSDASDGGTMYINSAYSQPIIFGVSANSSPSESVRIDANGITTGGSLNLNGINYTSTPNQIVINNPVGGAAGISLNNYYTAGDEWNLYVDPASTNFNIGQNTSKYISIASSGNVGIGTTTPNAPLTVFGEGVNNGLIASFSRRLAGEKSTFIFAGDYTYSGIGSEGNLYLKSGITSSDPYHSGTIGLTVNTNGNIGIGTTNPTNKLSIVSTSGVADTDNAIRWGNSTQETLGYLGASNPSYGSGAVFLYRNGGSNTVISANGDSLFRGGNVGIGNLSSAFYQLNVEGDMGIVGSGRLVFDYGNNGSLTSGIKSYAPGDSTLGVKFFATASGVTSDVMTILGNGNVGIGTTSPSAQLTTTGTVQFAHFGAGTLQTDASGNVSVSSDERLKDIQGNFTTGLEAIDKLNPINYKWKDTTGYDTVNTYTGFSAQNVQISIPEAVGVDKNGFLTLQDRPILATLVNAVKELSKMLEDMKLQISDIGNLLKDKVVAMKEAVVGTLRINDRVCVDDVCVTKEQFKQMLLNNGGSIGASNNPSPSIGNTSPDSSATTTESSDQNASSTTSTSTDNTAPSDTSAVSPEIAPEPTPDPSVSIPAPEPEPVALPAPTE